MTTARQGAPGATRICPHCRETILESAEICPVCRHHLRAGTRATVGAVATPLGFSPLHVEGSIRHPDVGGVWEYSVVVSVLDERGVELSRHVVGVGAITAHDRRKFMLDVEVFAPAGPAAPANVAVPSGRRP
ncbi:MAG TPA: hypothetical protein VIJ16_10110 [Gemmatimonadaceae bacterium]